MPARRSPSTAAAPVQSFRPTSGTVVGALGLAAAVVLLVVVLVAEPNLTGLRVALALAVVGLLDWMVMLRPRVTAYADTLRLRNMLSDTYLPLARVDDAVVRHTLNVWVDDQRYVCAGLGRSSRSMLREQRHGAAPSSGDDYAKFVETTIEDLARDARREAGATDVPVRRTWAVRELVALAVLVAALVVTMFL